MIDSPIPKTAGLADLLNLLKAEGLADFGEVFVFICATLKTRQFACAAKVIELVQSLLQSTRLVFVFSTENLVFARMNLKPTVFKNFAFD